jgi:hypothetical protein
MNAHRQVTAKEFARTHATDPDWVALTGGRLIPVFAPGDRISFSGFHGSVLGHYRNGMYEIRIQSGVSCVSGSDLVRLDG